MILQVLEESVSQSFRAMATEPQNKSQAKLQILSSPFFTLGDFTCTEAASRHLLNTCYVLAFHWGLDLAVNTRSQVPALVQLPFGWGRPREAQGGKCLFCKLNSLAVASPSTVTVTHR